MGLTMNAKASTDETLRAENAELRARLEDAEEMLRAIRAGEVDALVVEGDAGPQLFTLQGLDAEQNRLRSEMLAQVSDAVIAVDNEERVTFLNAAAERQYGVLADEALGRKLTELFSPHWPSREAEAGMRTALSERCAWRGELVHRRPDGSERHVETSVSALHDSDGASTGCVHVIRDITDRHLARKVLHERTAELQTLLNTLPGFVWIARDAECRLIVGNRTANEFVGVETDANVSQSVVATGEAPYLRQLKEDGTEYRVDELPLQRAMATGQPVRDAVLDFHFSDGRRAQVVGDAVPLFDEQGRICGGLAVFVDITQRKQAERTLAERTDLLNGVLESTTDVIFVKDLNGRILLANPACAAVFGSTPDQVVGKTCEELFPPDVAAAIRQHDEAVIAGESPVQLEETVPVAGEPRVALTLKTPLRDDGGRVVGVLGISRDITDRKREETLLKVSETRYRRLFESAKDGILILDAHAATITDANPFIAELLGYSPEELQGKELWQIGLFQDVEASKAAMQELQEKGYIRYEDLALETKAGQRINVEFVSNVYGEDGEAVIQCNIRDISDRKRLEESLRQHAADLSEVDRRKDEFLATLAHELRNPLAPVRMAVEVLRMKGPAIPELQWARDVIDRQTQAMTRLIDDLMDVSRINQGKLELQREQVELEKIVQGAVETSRPLIEKMGHELTVTLPPGPVIVNADLTRLAQVILNLLNNAAKYTERGGRIELRAELQGSDVMVSVTDTGIGIPADKLPTLFEMFSQVEGALSRSQGGLGIGLCLVKRLVEMHGGSIEAKSGGLGQGSEFVVRLPIVVERTYPRPASHDGDKAKSTSDLRILVVDDNRDAAESLAMLLKFMGNNVHTAHDGEEAVAAAGKFRPDVVLCDIGLPKLNGYQACRQMKEQAWDKKMILIAVTGWGNDDDRRRSEEAGFDHHMVKPVDPQALMKLLAGLDGVKV